MAPRWNPEHGSWGRGHVRAQPGRTCTLHILLVADAGCRQRAQLGLFNQSTFMWALPGVLASPSVAAGFREGACQEQVFQKTQAETTRLLVTEPGKPRCIPSTASYYGKQVTEAAQVQGEQTTQRHEYWEAWLIWHLWRPAPHTLTHGELRMILNLFFILV